MQTGEERTRKKEGRAKILGGKEELENSSNYDWLLFGKVESGLDTRLKI